MSVESESYDYSAVHTQDLVYNDKTPCNNGAVIRINIYKHYCRNYIITNAVKFCKTRIGKTEFSTGLPVRLVPKCSDWQKQPSQSGVEAVFPEVTWMFKVFLGCLEHHHIHTPQKWFHAKERV